jgi:hypothetical protein
MTPKHSMNQPSDPSVPAPPTECGELWVDTTIQVDKIFGPNRVQQRIRDRLKARPAQTAPYVKMEFIRGILPSVADVIEILRDVRQQGGDLREVLLRLPRGAFGREVGKRIMVLGNALQRNDPNDLRRAELRLRNFLEHWEIEFMDGLRLAKDDPLDCQWVTPAISTTPPLGPPPISCNYLTQRCRADQFVIKHRCSLQHVAQATGVRNETREAAERAIATPQRAKGQETCWPLGDTFIVLQAPQGATVYTTDREMKKICNVLKTRCCLESTGV